ncbi:MAG TPA: class I SAM-dependent methyltransferase [Solirubrobacteraceae bacterium]|nr:class I SAM-dependent methyltransferase [Solirubrobacteraceae bacterium]
MPGSFTRVTTLGKWQRLRTLIGQPASVASTDQGSAQTEPPDEDRSLDAAAGNGSPPPDAPSSDDPTRFIRGDFAPGRLAIEEATVTNLLYARLDDTDIAEIEQLIKDTDGAWEHYASAPDGASKRHVLLGFAAWLQARCLPEKTGLTGAQPPEDVHSMARDPLSAAGGLYDADLILDALRSAGAAIADIRAALDFGCSSGRVTRVLAAAYPDIRWHGCDPNGPAIAWASENLPGIEFFVNEDAPPLPLADGSLDLGYAISIWSHFAPELGLRWFQEMHRIIRPGGHLVCTTHGLTSIAYYATLNLRTPEQSLEIRKALYRDGSWYAPEFGEQGDWGVLNPEWGTAFLSPEWMLTHLCPAWRVLEFAPGRNQENQDVYVLQRV